MRGIETAPHELSANFNFVEWGLDPIFACDAVIKQADGQRVREFTSDGEQWIATLRCQESNIVHPGEQTPNGTKWQLQPDTSTEINTIKRSYRIETERAEEEDEHGQQGFVGHIRPRWTGIEGLGDDGETYQIGCEWEGINVDIYGRNIEFARYPQLLVEGFAAVDVNPRYVDEIHESSNINDAGRYVRIHREESGPIHAPAGPLANLYHVCMSDRDGYRKLVQQDVNERGEQTPGYYHTTTLGSKRINKIWPSHHLPKEIKHYEAQEGANLPESHPMAHPKLGASYQASRTSHDETLYWDDLDQLNEELEETVRSVLQDAGIPLHSTTPYVDQDEYFDITFEDTEQPTKLNITQIRQEQESVVVRHLADGLSPVQWDALSQLITDGGEVSPDDIAENGGWHVESVRRALRDMEQLVERQYAEVGLRSDYVAEMVHDAVQQAEEAVTTAVETAADAIDSAERAVDESMAAWVAWCDKHDVDIDNRREQMRLDFPSRTEHTLKAKLLRAQKMWQAAGQDLRRLRTADVYVDGRRRGKVMKMVNTPR